MKLLLGLGNIGVEFENTYHNLGFYVVDCFLAAKKIEPNFKKLKHSIYLKTKFKENDLIISSLLYEKLGYEGDPFGKKIELFIDGDIYEFNIVGITKNLSSQIYLKLETFKEIFNLEETKFYITPKNYESYQKLMELFLVNNIDSELSDLTSIDKIDSIKSIKYIYT